MQNDQIVVDFAEACKVEGYDSATVIPDLSSYPEDLRPALQAVAELLIINKAANRTPEGPWKPDYNDYGERKWEPWFDLEKEESNPSGFRFDVSVFGYSSSVVGSRLSYRTKEISEAVAKANEGRYKDFMVIS